MALKITAKIFISLAEGLTSGALSTFTKNSDLGTNNRDKPRSFWIVHFNSRTAPSVGPLSSEIGYFCLHKGLEITAKIFISLPEGQRRWHSQLFSKIAILTQILAQVNQGVFGKCIYGNRLCSLLRPAWPRQAYTPNPKPTGLTCETKLPKCTTQNS